MRPGRHLRAELRRLHTRTGTLQRAERLASPAHRERGLPVQHRPHQHERRPRLGGGTLGQNYDAFTPARALQQGQTAYLAQLQENPAYRTNIALTNAGAAPAQVTVTLFDGGGIQIGQYIVSLAPGERKQEDRPFSTKAGQNALAAGYARVTVTQGSGNIASASVVDNTTNDPTTMPAI